MLDEHYSLCCSAPNQPTSDNKKETQSTHFTENIRVIVISTINLIVIPQNKT